MRQKALTNAWTILVVAALVCAAAYVVWRQADHDPERSRAALRDSALIDGIHAVEAMNSMDYRHVAAGFKAWSDISTGVLHDQLATVGDDEKQLVADQGKITTGHVVEAAVTDLSATTATVIAAVEITVATDDKDAEPTVKRNRYAADLVLVRGDWKLENLQQVAVTTS